VSGPWERFGPPVAESGPWAAFDRRATPREAPPYDNSWVADEMSFGKQVLAGTGKAFSDIATGAKQLVGMGPGAQEVEEMRKRDAPLMKTGGGLTGNIVGNISALAPLAVVPGANTVAGAGTLGALAAAVQPAKDAGERLWEMGKGALLGGGVQAVASRPVQTLEAVKSVASAPFKAASAAVEPFYQGGREKILARALRESVGQNSDDVIQRLKGSGELVLGSLPTAAEAGGSPGLAAMQRSAAAVDPEQYATRAAQQNEARVKALRDIAGTSGARDAAASARSSAANKQYETAYANGVDPLGMGVDPLVQKELNTLLKRPALKTALNDARTLAANEGANLKDAASQVKGLDYIKRALDDQIAGAVGNEQRVLTDLKNQLTGVVDKLSPEYAAARSTFQKMSRPIAQMDVAQTIADKAIRPLDDTLQPAAYARALSDDTAQSATGFGKATLANTVDPKSLGTLNALKEDLARSVYARDAGRGAGSDTVQKLAMTNLLQRSGMPLGVLNMPVAGRVGNWAYQVADEQMRNQLARSLLNPQETARLMSAAPKPPLPVAELPGPVRDRAAMLARMLALPATSN
jgi:hypothetical protein